MTSKVIYTGGLSTTCEHLRSGNSFITDAPLDNNGLGQAFSPTDTIASGLASYMLTVTNGLGVDLTNAIAEFTKHMETDPRCISQIDVLMKLPGNIGEKEKKILEHTANTCPVQYSLHPDIVRNITFSWEL